MKNALMLLTVGMMLATGGNLYTAEVGTGRRAQKFARLE
jgi:hypothetical protein